VRVEQSQGAASLPFSKALLVSLALKLKWRLREDRFLVKKLPSKILPGRPEPISSIGTRMVILWLEKQKMDLQRP
jgi:hypothetical protein